MRKLISKTNLSKNEYPTELVEFRCITLLTCNRKWVLQTLGIRQLSAIYEILFRALRIIFADDREIRKTNGWGGVMEAAMSNWLWIFGTPDIVMADIDTTFAWDPPR